MELGVTNLLHLTFLLSCSALFIMNVYVTLRTFIRRETIQTVSQRLPDTPVYFPVIVVCSNNPFKDEDRPMLTLEDYDENSFNVEEYIVSLSSTFHSGATTWKNTTLNTLMHGKCVAYEMEQEIEDFEPFSGYGCIEVNISRKLDIYLMNQYDLLPFVWGDMTAEDQLKRNKVTTGNHTADYNAAMNIDYYVDKTWENNCNGEDITRIMDCTKISLRKASPFKCFTPWLWSLYGQFNNKDEYKPCNYADNLESMRWLAFGEMWEDWQQTCPWPPCKRQSFRIELMTYGEGAIKQALKTGKWSEFFTNDDTQHTCVYLHKKTATYHITTYRVDFNDLVNAVGGGLGLFLGFSLLTTLTKAKEFLSKMLLRANKSKPFQGVKQDEL